MVPPWLSREANAPTKPDEEMGFCWLAPLRMKALAGLSIDILIVRDKLARPIGAVVVDEADG